MIAGCRIDRLVGSGGMGLVYAARQAALDRDVAIKVMHPSLADDEAFRLRFEAEALSAAKLTHPNVITVHAAGIDDECLLYIVMELATTDLRRLCKQHGPFSPADAVRLIGQIAGALDAAHDAGLVYRDLKPANVLVNGSAGCETLYLTDFGLAKADRHSRALTATGAVPGTIDYIAPERFNGQPGDARSDIYALGVLLYELLTGVVPFAGEDEATKHRHARGGDQRAPEPAGALAPGISVELDDVIARAMRRDPAERFASAGALADAAAVAASLTTVAASAIPAATPDARGHRSGGDERDNGHGGRRDAPVPPAAHRRRRMLLAGVTLMAATTLAVVTAGTGTEPSCAAARSGDIDVRFMYSAGAAKQTLLEPLIKRFNCEGHRIGRRVITVTPDNSSYSGDLVRQIAERTLTPTAWSPADTSWGDRLNYRVQRRQGQRCRGGDSAPDDCRWVSGGTVLISSATSIAMWEPVAKMLGWPEPVGWSAVLKLLSSDQRAVSFAHPSPVASTTGLQATLAEYQFAAGTTTRLEPGDLDREARRIVQRIERAIVHYGKSATHAEDELIAKGQAYASIVALGEVAVLNVNRERRRKGIGGPPLVAVYPAEGTFTRDEPYYVLQAPWVDADERRAAQTFGAYLKANITPRVAMEHGYRPGDPEAELPARLVQRWSELGVEPLRKTRALTMPRAAVASMIERMWQEDRKPARVQIVLDTSGSMSGARLQRARSGLRALIKEVAPQDRIGLTAAPGPAQALVGLGRRFSTARTQLERAIFELPVTGSGEPAALDAIRDAVDALTTPRSADTIDAVILLTSGDDTASVQQQRDLLRRLHTEGMARQPVRLFTILYPPDGLPAAAPVRRAAARLAALAEATGGLGTVYSDENTIANVYRDIPPSF